MKIIKLTILFFCFSLYSQTGKVIKIKDGDTIVVLDSLNNQITLRLAEVDCPEKVQAYGNKAKKFTANEVGSKMVTYKVESKDKYGRSIAKVFYNGKYLSKEIIKNGWGWHYKKYSNSNELSDLEILAKNNKRGLWNEKYPTAPWDFREKNKYSTHFGRH